MNEKKSSKEIDDTPLNYIKINQKNIIEELTEEDYISITSNLLKTFTIIEDNIGSEINKFFNILIPESKESDQLKLNIAISSKSKVENTILDNYLNDIMNRPELNYVVLNKEMNEQISTIIKEAYKKLKLKKIIFLLDKNESNIPFKIEQTIDLKEYAFNPQKNFKYDLRGIISYDNNKKIFVAFIKSHINKKWYLYMDEIVEEKNDINEVLNDNNNKYVHYSLMYAQAVGA